MNTESEDRAQTELLGGALLIAIVVLGTIGLLLTGGQQVTDSRQGVEIAHATNLMRSLDAGASSVVLGVGDGKRQRLDAGAVSLDGELRTTEDSWMRVTLVSATTGDTETDVVNTSLGTVLYVDGKTTVGYEGGGIWRSDRDGTVLVSRPEFTFRDRTLTLPIIALSGDPSLTTPISIGRDGPRERLFPNRTANLTNTLDATKVRVTVHSRYYEAWGRYFRDTTNGSVRVDHATETATVSFPAPNTGPSAFPSGIVATAGDGYLRFGGMGAYSDSYDSEAGDYNATRGENGTVVAAGDVKSTGNSSVFGDIWSGSVVDLDGETQVSGSVYWTEAYHQNGAAVAGDNESIPGIASIEPIDGYVRERVTAVRSTNDNNDTAVITDDRLNVSDDGSGGLPTATLGSGRYYLENLTLAGERLVLNTTDGNVTIAVRDYMLLDRGGAGNPGSNITVTGDGVARIYVANRDKILIEKSGHNNLDRDRRLNVYVSIDSKVHIPGDRSPQLRVFGPRGLSMAMAGSGSKPTYFHGYVYAPAGLDGDGYVYIKHAEVYGGIVTGNLTVGQSGAIHYDMSLSRQTIPESPGVARIEYLHVTVHRANVTSP